MFKEERTEFKFEWSHLGDIALGRPNLGNTTTVAIYRLMQFTLRDAMIKHTDVNTAERVFYDAGFNSGKAFYDNLITEKKDFNRFISELQSLLKELRIGILRLEDIDIENLNFTLTVSEDLDCSGLPIHSESICTFDEGFIAALFNSFTGVTFSVKEIDCWCTGDRTCRFKAIGAS